MKINKIAVLDVHNMFGEKLAAQIRQVCPQAQVYVARDIDGIKALTSDIDVLITWPFIDRRIEDFCAGAASLRWIHAFTAGVDGIVKSRLGEMDLKITATKGIHGPAISDHVLACIFSSLRNFPALLAFQRQKVWYRSREFPDMPELATEESEGKTVGVIGMGSIGTCIARKCKLLGMRVVGLRRTPAPGEWIDACYSPGELDRLLNESDFVVIAAPATSETVGMIGKDQFEQMKRSAYLINISRGSVVDEKELIKALQDKKIAGAALDVFASEPLDKNSPLWEMDNVIITPHVSANSRLSKDVRAYEAILDNIRRYLDDRPLNYVVDPGRGY